MAIIRVKLKVLPLPDLPINRRSLNRATLFLKVVVLFRNSAENSSSFPAKTVTWVPSGTEMGSIATILNGAGRDLFFRQ